MVLGLVLLSNSFGFLVPAVAITCAVLLYFFHIMVEMYSFLPFCCFFLISSQVTVAVEEGAYMNRLPSGLLLSFEKCLLPFFSPNERMCRIKSNWEKFL